MFARDEGGGGGEGEDGLWSKDTEKGLKCSGYNYLHSSTESTMLLTSCFYEVYLPRLSCHKPCRPYFTYILSVPPYNEPL